MCIFDVKLIMKNPRLLYRVFLKLFALLGIIILLYVMVGSLFVPKEEQGKLKIENISVDLSDIENGKTINLSWSGRAVIILKGEDRAHTFVYFNTGDSGNCPLFYSSSVFKDTCTGTVFDERGSEKNSNAPKTLVSPPYFFKGNTIVIGK